MTLESIREAASALRGCIVETPTTHSRTLSEKTGAEVWLKHENLQFTASFKERGALTKLLSLDAAARRAGVIAMSAGNHAQAVAYHAQRLGIPATIVMPRFTPNVKVEHTQAFGAEVILSGESLEDAGDSAHQIAGERGLCLIHPYDDLEVIRGQGTIALEVLAAQPELDALVVPIGGGGLIAGSAVAARGIRPQIEIIGVEAARFPTMRQALAGEPIECGDSTIAEGIGRLTLPIVRELVSSILVVDEFRIEEAVLLLLEIEKTVVEGAGAAALAALLAEPERFVGRRVGLILSGGNIDLLPLSSVMQRGLVRSGRLVRLRVEVRDVPGSLAEVASAIGEAGGNIIETHHKRAFTNLPLQSAELEVVVQARGAEHLREILERLAAGGYRAEAVGIEPG
ncbi:MAG: threonine ammonia-lyase [Deltaproteobacteria bacterium]|nr:threonine ammonia-lyase [Deltaproteobacteria bacterium]